nr:hypothetical protein [Providencia sp. PROV019]
MSKQMMLYARTNNQGSTCSTDIGYTESEWAKLSEDERLEVIAEYTGDVVDLWVQPEEQGWIRKIESSLTMQC